jgi:hypothetical protein
VGQTVTPKVQGRGTKEDTTSPEITASPQQVTFTSSKAALQSIQFQFISIEAATRYIALSEFVRSSF